MLKKLLDCQEQFESKGLLASFDHAVLSALTSPSYSSSY